MEFELALAIADAAVIEAIGRHFNDVETAILRGSWQGQTYEQIADTSGYSVSYLTRDIGPKLWKLLSKALGEPVSKTSFRAALERQGQDLAPSVPDPDPAASNLDDAAAQPSGWQPRDRTPAPSAIAPRTDWGEAPDVSVFFGREDELATLTQWIRRDRCRLVLLLGMGGIGKTSLAARLAQELAGEVGGKGVRESGGEGVRESGGSAITPSPHHPYPTGSRSASTSPLPRHPITPHPFTHVIWRSLRNAPQLDDLLRELVAFLSDQQETETTLPRLMHWLRAQRCLIVLDNVETILLSGEDLDTPTRRGVGRYRPGYEDYGNFIRVLGETPHQSCLLLTSREKLTTVVPMEAEDGKVRSHQLSGSPAVAEALLTAKGLQGTAEQRRQLGDRYSGNPLALKLVASTIQDLFDGDIAPFLAQETVVFNGIRRLLDQQFARLSGLEQTIMTWLAINRDWTAIAELAADVVPAISRGKLLEALESLGWRGLIERRAGSYTQQPVVMEYITDSLIQQMANELTTTEFDGFLRFALLKTTVKAYIRDSQERMILRPVAEQVSGTFRSQAALEQQILRILIGLRQRETQLSGYGTGNLINLCRHLDIDLSGFDFSGLTIRQAYLQGMTLTQVNLSHAHFVQPSFSEAFGLVFSVAFSPDDTLVASADGSGQIRLWRVSDRQPVLSIKAITSWILTLKFSPDGRMLASGNSENQIHLWDVATGKCLRLLQGHRGVVWCSSFDPTGQYLATGSDDGCIHLWDVRAGQVLHRLQGHTHYIQSLDFSPAGDRLISASLDQTIRLWNPHNGELLRTIAVPEAAPVSVRFSPGGSYLASGHSNGTISFWDSHTGQCLETLQQQRLGVSAVRFSPQGDLLASAHADGAIYLWNTHTKRLVKTLKSDARWTWSIPWSIDFSSDGQFLVSGDNDHAIKFWQVDTGHLLQTWQGHSSWVMAIAVFPDDRHIISGHSDSAMRIWDIAQKKPVQTLPTDQNWVMSVSVSPCGQYFASGGGDGSIALWDARSHTHLRTLTDHARSVWDLHFSADSRTLASAGLDGTVKLWDVATGTLLKTLTGHTNMVWATRFSPDGHTLVSSSHDCTVKLWNLERDDCLHSLSYDQPPWSVRFSPDGQLLAAGGNDGAILIWQVATYTRLHTWMGHSASVPSVCFSPDGKTLVSGSDDHTLKLWDVATSTLLKTYRGHISRVANVGFNRTGTRIVSGSADETLKVWDVSSGNCLQTYRADRPYEGMNITGATGLTDAQRVSLQALGAVDG